MGISVAVNGFAQKSLNSFQPHPFSMSLSTRKPAWSPYVVVPVLLPLFCYGPDYRRDFVPD